MPVATFSKSGVPTFTFEKGSFLPINRPRIPNQIIGVAGGGQKKVAKVGERARQFPIIMNRVSSTQHDNLWTFIEDTNIDYALNTFTFTNEDSTAYTVRLMDRKVDIPRVKGGLYNIRLLLEVEII